LNVHRVNDVRQIEIHTVDPLVPEPSPSEIEIAIAKFKKYKSPGIDQISAKVIQAGGETLRYGSYKFINSIWNNEEFPEQLEESITIPIQRRR
jgi:hypothetical protein